MLAGLIIVGVAAVIAFGALAVIALHSRLAPGPTLVGRTVVIHTRRPDDQSIRGVLHGQYADRWTLRDAYVVTAVGENAAGGLQHIPVANIAWAQELQPTHEERG